MNKWDDFIRKKIIAMSGSINPYGIFNTWVLLSMISISNSCDVIHGELWRSREERYKSLVEIYSEEDIKQFADMTGALALSMEESMHDALGAIYMGLNMGSSRTGQFFTPYHLSQLVAFSSVKREVFEDSVRVVYEPSCGSGGMIIATAERLQQLGVNYQKHMRVIAQDIDNMCTAMCYVQLSLLGIRGIVVQGNTITEPFNYNYPRERVFRTPAEAGALI